MKLDTRHLIDLITRRSLVQIRSPQPQKKRHRRRREKPPIVSGVFSCRIDSYLAATGQWRCWNANTLLCSSALSPLVFLSGLSYGDTGLLENSSHRQLLSLKKLFSLAFYPIPGLLTKTVGNFLHRRHLYTHTHFSDAQSQILAAGRQGI